MLQIPPSQRRMKTSVSMKLNQALKMAAEKFKKGAIEEASQIYLDVLEKFPKNKTALLAIKALKEERTKKIAKNENPDPEIIRTLVSLYNQGKIHQLLIQINQIKTDQHIYVSTHLSQLYLHLVQIKNLEQS